MMMNKKKKTSIYDAFLFSCYFSLFSFLYIISSLMTEIQCIANWQSVSSSEQQNKQEF